MKKALLFLCLAFVLSACGRGKDYLITIHTEYGDMKVILFDETPLHKKNFIDLAKAGRYDSTIWHRIIDGFMIQGGDVFAKEDIQESESDRIPAEIVSGLWHRKGAIAAARMSDHVNPKKMSSGVQFYIVQGKVYTEDQLTVDLNKLYQGISQLLNDPNYSERFTDLKQKFTDLQIARNDEGTMQLALSCSGLVKDELSLDVTKSIEPDRLALYTTVGGTPHLDNEYTVFGLVVDGLDVIDKIAAVKTSRERPIKNSYMTMEVELVSKREITKKYGYEYPKEK